ncbi:hypothetical protein BHM03_00027907 [Ensete ventricosum]|nr:hypothetical protein BHM03_00027907 [Ensete ventricosum]
MRPCKMGCVAQRPKELYKAHRGGAEQCIDYSVRRSSPRGSWSPKLPEGRMQRGKLLQQDRYPGGIGPGSPKGESCSHGLDNAMVPQRLDFRGVIDPLLSWRESVDRKKGRGGGECRGKQQVSRQGERAEAMELHMTDVDELLIKIAESERLRVNAVLNQETK